MVRTSHRIDERTRVEASSHGPSSKNPFFPTSVVNVPSDSGHHQSFAKWLGRERQMQRSCHCGSPRYSLQITRKERSRQVQALRPLRNIRFMPRGYPRRALTPPHSQHQPGMDGPLGMDIHIFNL